MQVEGFESYTVHHAPYTLYPTPCTLHPKHWTGNQVLETLVFKLKKQLKDKEKKQVRPPHCLPKPSSLNPNAYMGTSLIKNSPSTSDHHRALG